MAPSNKLNNFLRLIFQSRALRSATDLFILCIDFESCGLSKDEAQEELNRRMNNIMNEHSEFNKILTKTMEYFGKNELKKIHPITLFIRKTKGLFECMKETIGDLADEDAEFVALSKTSLKSYADELKKGIKEMKVKLEELAKEEEDKQQEKTSEELGNESEEKKEAQKSEEKEKKDSGEGKEKEETAPGQEEETVVEETLQNTQNKEEAQLSVRPQNENQTRQEIGADKENQRDAENQQNSPEEVVEQMNVLTEKKKGGNISDDKKVAAPENEENLQEMESETGKGDIADTTQEEQMVLVNDMEEPDLGPVEQVTPEPKSAQEVFDEDEKDVEELEDVHDDRERAENQGTEEPVKNAPIAGIPENNEEIEEDDVVDNVEEEQGKQLKAMIVPQRNAAKRVRLEESITAPVPKRGRKKTVKPVETHDRWTEGVRYYTALLVLSCLRTMDKPQAVLETMKKKVFGYAGMEEEQPETGEVHITEDDILDTGNYRGLNNYCAERTNTVKDPIVLSDSDEDDDEEEGMKEKRQKAIRKNLKDNWKIFQLRFASPMFLDPIISTGEEITEAVKKGVRKWKNLVYDSVTSFEFPDLSSDLVKEEYTRTKDRCQNKKRNDLEKDHWLHIPTPIINAADYSQDEIRKLAQRPMVCIRGLDQANRHGAGIVLENFRLSAKVGDHRFSRVDAYKQMAQQLRTNCDLQTGSSTWNGQKTEVEVMKLEEFKQESRKHVDIAMRYLEDLDNFKKENFDKLMEELAEDPKSFRNLFGANYPIPGDASEATPRTEKFYKDIWTEIGKMLKWLQPNNNEDLLHCTNAIHDGINRAQLYFKTPTVRTPAHMENCGLASMNLNAGPDASMWYAVPFEFTKELEKLVKAKSRASMFTAYWPLEEDIREAGIPLQVFCQKAGDTVWLNPGTIHWVQSMGYSTHISWNLGQPSKSQLDIMAILHDQQKLKHELAPNVAMQAMIWNLVKDRMVVEEGAEVTVVHMFAKILAYMQYELSIVELLGETTEEWPKETKNWKSYCRTCGIELFNLVVRRGEQSYCIRHFASFRQNNKPVFYRRNSIEEGRRLYDNYVRDNADKLRSQSC